MLCLYRKHANTAEKNMPFLVVVPRHHVFAEEVVRRYTREHRKDETWFVKNAGLCSQPQKTTVSGLDSAADNVFRITVFNLKKKYALFVG
jgi:hypothetical protein